MLGALIALGCLGPPPADSGVTVIPTDVAITDVDWGCSADDDTWWFVVDTAGWTDGGLLAMTADQRRVEAHDLLSVEAAADGTWDRLELELDIVGDPADAVDGSKTAWLCDAETLDEMAFRLSVSERNVGTVDCRVWGVETDWNGLAGYSTCEETLED